MTRQSKANGLPDSLPKRKSPRALDEKILAYAKSSALEKPRSYKPAWMSGLAAASIVGIAVMIALPEGPDPAIKARMELMDLPASSEIDFDAQAQMREHSHKTTIRSPAGHSGTLAESNLAQDAAGSGTAHFDPEKAQPETQLAVESSTLPAKRVASETFLSQVEAPSAAAPEPAALQSKPEVGASKKSAVFERRIVPPRQPESSEVGFRGPSQSDMIIKERRANSPAKEGLWEKPAKPLERCILMARNANIDKARTCYAELRENCAGSDDGRASSGDETAGGSIPADDKARCKLPETLEDAVRLFHFTSDPNSPLVYRNE